MPVFQAERERLGKRIRQARVDAKLSHDQLGALVGTSRQHLIKLEKAQHTPREDMLARIAEATGQPLEFFTDGARRERREADPDDEEAASMALALFDQLAAFVALRASSAMAGEAPA